MNWFLRLFPAYLLMESALIASRREAEDLRTELNIARMTATEAKARYEEERAELKVLRNEQVESLKQTANFMAYAKTARMIFVQPGSDLPVSAPPVTPEQLRGAVHGRDLVAQATRQFNDALRKDFEEAA